MSFEYRGHSASSGTFELDKVLVDTRQALEWASAYAREPGIPLHGMATCFGNVSLLSQFAGRAPACSLRSLSAVSGLFRLDQVLRFERFAPVLACHLGRRLEKRAMLDGIAGQRFDVNGEAFRGALQEYLTGLFPELRVGWDYFEELRYDRVSIPRTLLQLSQACYLDNVSVPRGIPCRFYCGRQDDLLGLDTPEGRQAYRDHVLGLIPHAELWEMDFDHYGRGPDHETVFESLGDFFEACEVDRTQRGWTRDVALCRGGVR